MSEYTSCHHSFTPAAKGWECPKCGAVMAPFAPSCFYCKPKMENSIPINIPLIKDKSSILVGCSND